MIQRKQTVFILLALVATIACLCLPLGFVSPDGMGADSSLHNLALVDGNNGKWDFSPCVLFVWLALSCPVGVVAMLKYKKRMLQARLCAVNMLLMALWMLSLAAISLVALPKGASLHLGFAACLPLVSFILYFMARKAIIADEKLVRSIDRIR